MATNPAKQLQLHGAERLDLNDALFGFQEGLSAMQASLVQAVLGTGVLEGFRGRPVSPQTGSFKGQLDIFNGVSYDHLGNLVNAQTGTTTYRLQLGSPSTEYWLELEFYWKHTDPDNRAFFDTTVDNTSPLPDGQEINVPRVFTRRTLFWRIKRPIRQNAAERRDDSGYTPAHFSASDTLVVPLFCINTDSQGAIIPGGADTAPENVIPGDTNDIISFATSGGTQQYIQVAGYGETKKNDSNGNPYVYAKKTTDQRIRVFEPLQPAFLYGATNEVNGDARSDQWARDSKSAYDHLAWAIAEIKEGADGFSLGNYHNATVASWDTGLLRWVDIKDIKDNASVPSTISIDPNQFIGCTFQIMDGHWAGFYARISGNDRTAGGPGNTRLYLQHPSGFPKWKEAPASDAACRIVQHRSVNWVAKPQPNSSYRGLNALDKEVVDARTDRRTGYTYAFLKNRLDANKGPALTISLLDFRDSSTGEVSSSRASGDLPAPNGLTTELQLAISKIADDGGGTIRWRTGKHYYAALSTPVITLDSKKGLIFEGEGQYTTSLEAGNSSGLTVAADNTVFALNNCSDIVFRNMRIAGIGKVMTITNCSNIKFINCTIEGFYYENAAGPSTTSMDMNFSEDLTFENCEIHLSGLGMVFGERASDISFLHCLIRNDGERPHNTTLIDTGWASGCTWSNCTIRGSSINSGIRSTRWDSSKFHHNTVLYDSQFDQGGGFIWVDGFVISSHISHNSFNRNTNPVATNGPHLRIVALDRSKVMANSALGVYIPFFLREDTTSGNYARRSTVAHNWIQGGSDTTSGVYGIEMQYAQRCHIVANHVEFSNVAIRLDDTNNCTVLGNFVHEGATGISMDSACEAVIVGNNCLDQTVYGINLEDASYNHISGNNVSGAGLTEPYNLNGSDHIRGEHTATFTHDSGTNAMSSHNTYLTKP